MDEVTDPSLTVLQKKTNLSLMDLLRRNSTRVMSGNTWSDITCHASCYPKDLFLSYWKENDEDPHKHSSQK